MIACWPQKMVRFGPIIQPGRWTLPKWQGRQKLQTPIGAKCTGRSTLHHDVVAPAALASQVCAPHLLAGFYYAAEHSYADSDPEIRGRSGYSDEQGNQGRAFQEDNQAVSLSFPLPLMRGKSGAPLDFGQTAIEPTIPILAPVSAAASDGSQARIDDDHHENDGTINK